MKVADSHLAVIQREIAHLHPKDAADVLSMLDPEQRRRLEDMEVVPPECVDPMIPLFNPALAQRLISGDGMTREAHSALVACARDVCPVNAIALRPPVSLLGRISALFSGGHA